MVTHSALTVRPGGVLPSRTDFDEMLTMAEEFAQSGILPKGVPPKRAAVLYIVQTGYELGIPAATSLRMISLVEGKPTLDAQIQRALIYRDHGDDAFRFVETDATRCTVEYKRKGWQSPARFTLTMTEISADLRKKYNWRDYPANMLRARATTFVANMAFSDSTLGLYTADELIEATGGEVGIGADGEPVVIAARVVMPVEQDRSAQEDAQEPSSITLPLGMSPEMWAALHSEATERGVEFDPRMTPDQMAGAIRKAGGPAIPGQMSVGALRYALRKVPMPSGQRIDAQATGIAVPVSDADPIRDDEIVVEQVSTVNG